jgi:hypothetical protein
VSYEVELIVLFIEYIIRKIRQGLVLKLETEKEAVYELDTKLVHN